MKNSSKFSRMIGGLVLIAAVAGSSVAALAGDFTVLVNSSVADSSLSKDELKQLMMANKTAWKDGKKVAIVTLGYGSDEADTVTKEFMGMTSVQAKKHWLTKVFSGIIPAVPAAADSADEAAEMVAKTAGAIAILPGKVAPGKAKVLDVK